MKIMLADDEKSIRSLVKMIVTGEGYRYCCASDGEDALAVCRTENPDLIILDVMMAKLNGFEVCRKLREGGSDVPIIILSAKGDIVDKSIGFKAGADDYMVKPFISEELLLRIEALLRRRDRKNTQFGVNDSDTYRTGDLEISFIRHELKVRDVLVELTPTEFKILEYMALRPGAVISHEQLLEYIWGQNYTGELTTIAVFIRKIRKKIETNPSKPKYIQTVWGIGYKFTDLE